MKILVTGGSGWVGAHLVNYLKEKRHDVTNYDIKEGFDITDYEQLRAVFRNGEFERVYHLAAQAFLGPGERDPYRDLDINAKGMINLLRVLEENPIPMVYTSSGAVYGLSKVPHREDETPIPASNYGISKYTAENYLRKWVITKGINAKIIRFSSVYGRGRTEGPVNIFLNKALKGEKLTVYGDGLQTRDMVYIEDALKGLDVVMEKGEIGELYNIGTGIESSVMQVANIISDIFGSEIVFIEHEYGPFDLKRSWYNISKISKLGYQPKYTLEEGIKLTLEETKSVSR